MTAADQYRNFVGKTSEMPPRDDGIRFGLIEMPGMTPKGYLAGMALALGNLKSAIFFGAILSQAFDLSIMLLIGGSG